MGNFAKNLNLDKHVLPPDNLDQSCNISINIDPLAWWR